MLCEVFVENQVDDFSPISVYTEGVLTDRICKALSKGAAPRLAPRPLMYHSSLRYLLILTLFPPFSGSLLSRMSVKRVATHERLYRTCLDRAYDFKKFILRQSCLHVQSHSSCCTPYWYEAFPASPLPPPLAEFSTLQSIRPHTVVEPSVVQPRLTGSGLAASQKGLYWCAVGLALVSTPGPHGS